jgi:hypothetical protein
MGYFWTVASFNGCPFALSKPIGYAHTTAISACASLTPAPSVNALGQVVRDRVCVSDCHSSYSGGRGAKVSFSNRVYFSPTLRPYFHNIWSHVRAFLRLPR